MTTKKTELAGSPNPESQSSTELALKENRRNTAWNTDLTKQLPGDKFRRIVVEGLARGMKGPDIARQLAPNDPKKQKAIRYKIRKLLANDPRLAAMVHAEAKGVAIAGLIPAVEGLAERAARGRPDAVKPLMAVTKFHDPSIKHEHTGEVKVTIDMPRPVKVSSEEPEAPVIDAEVVEEG